MKRRPGPGLRKASALPLVEERVVRALRGTDYRWRELFETADVVSEGATREENDGPVYYGSTSVLLPSLSRGGRITDAEVARARQVVARDPHCRLRAVRIACLEAELRARAPLGCVRAELFVRDDARGVRIDVDVEAKVLAHEQTRPRRARTRD